MNNTLPGFRSSLFLGLEDLEEMLCKVARPEDTFPPYNIEHLEEGRILISLAVAGYKEQDLEVSLEGKELTIRGRQDQGAGRHFTHKGIAARAFIKTFFIADGMKVESVILEYGLLNIVVRRPVQKTKRTVLKINAPQTNPYVIETKAGENDTAD